MALTMEAQQRQARLRKWSARAWWFGVHVYVYTVLIYYGAISPDALPMTDFVALVVVAVANLGIYILLQTSSPGYLNKYDDLEAAEGQSALDERRDVEADGLMSNREGNDGSRRARHELHYCDVCHITQPLRAKHCKDCGRCVRQYDHHCDCAGTCVGEDNRRKFVGYLFIQCLEAILAIGPAASAFTMQDSVDEWFKANWPFIIAWFILGCVLLIAIPLFLYQAFLISTNQQLKQPLVLYELICLSSMSESGALHIAAVVVVSGVFVTVAALVAWMRVPITEAARLAKTVDPPEESVFEDPNDSNPATRFHQFASLGEEQATCSLSVIIPAFNEQDRILVTLHDTVTFLEEKKRQDASFTYEILVVDDCSQDKTVDVVIGEIKKHTIDRIRLLKLQTNHGKGGAIRKGVMRARGAKILFADADNATDIRDYAKLEQAMDSLSDKHGIIVCGSRAHLEEEAIAKRHPIRNLLMHGFHLIVSTLCVKDVRDTQCGFKLFDRTAARIVFTPMHIERWAFDVELLYIAGARGLTVKEVAVQWTEVPGSKLNVVVATITMLREIILIRLCYTLGIWKLNDGGFRLRTRSATK